MRRIVTVLLCIMMVWMTRTAPAPAAEPQPIFEYESSLGTMPYDQGWSIEAQTLRRGGPGDGDCPLMPVDLGAWEFECYWYGGPDENPRNGLHDNDGTLLADPSPVGNSGGGYLDASDSPVADTDNNRLTTNPDDGFKGYYVNYVWAGGTTWKATETYSEWMEFDDGDDNLEHVATLSGPRTPKGAGDFPGAPPHQALRLVGGDGNGTLNSLPFVASFNNQNGQAMLRKSYETMGITGTITVVFRGALSMTQEGQANHAFLLVRAYDPGADKTVYFAFTWFMPRTYSGGVPICDTDPVSPDCGKFGVVNLQNGTSAQACAGADGSTFDKPLLDGSGGGPDIGRVMPHEFFTFRVICDPSNGGSAEIFLNEDTPNRTTGIVTNTTYGPDFKWGCKNGIGGDDRRMVKVGLRHEDDTTMWIDYVKVYQGAVQPPEIGPCTFASDPVFDVTGAAADAADGMVDEQDLDVFSTECYTGPAPPVGAFDALSDRCRCMDLNGDEAIDHEDFGRFQACYTGDDGILDKSCDD